MARELGRGGTLRPGCGKGGVKGMTDGNGIVIYILEKEVSLKDKR